MSSETGLTICPRILVLSGVQGDTRRYRTHHLYEQLRLAGADCTLGHISAPGVLRWTSKAQILILHRIALDEVSGRMIAAARKRGALLLLDVDDLVFDREAVRWIDSPDFADPTRLRLYQENIDRNRAVLERCDALLASTGFLAAAGQQLGKPAWVHRNGFSLEMLARSTAAWSARPPARDPRVVIGYASGTRTHDQDFALARPALQNVLNGYAQTELLLAGRLDPGAGWDAFGERVQRAPFVPWRQLPATLAGLDINLAPLRTDNPFCQSKSEIKFMEAALAGAPTIASPTEAFQHAIRAGENGILAATPDEWEAGLRGWIDHPDERLRVAQAARLDVLREYSPWARAGQIAQTLNAICAAMGYDYAIPAAQAQPAPPESLRGLWVGEEEERHPTLLERGLYSLRSRGVSTLAQEVWIYLRRMAEPIFPFRRND